MFRVAFGIPLLAPLDHDVGVADRLAHADGQRHFRFFLRRQAVVNGFNPGLRGWSAIFATSACSEPWRSKPRRMFPVSGATRCYENGIFVRTLGDTLILSPPLIINQDQIDQIADGIKNGIRAL